MENKTGSGNKGLDWIIVAGMIAAFPKTADLLSYWSPLWLNEMFGFNVKLFYGAFCAAMVEGTILFLHFDRRAHRLASAQTVKWILLAVSFACQIFDGFVNTETASQMSDSMKAILTYGVPALPLIIAVIVSTIELPAEGERKPRVGLKNRLPNLREIWEGEKVEEPKEESTVLPTVKEVVRQVKPSDNGVKPEEDFISRRS